MWWKKIVFTLAFTVYGVLFYSIFYFIMKWYFPQMLQVPDPINTEYFIQLVIFYTALVILSYVGAGYLVYKDPRGPGREQEGSWKSPGPNSRVKR